MVDGETIGERVAALLAGHDPADRLEFLRARFDAGLAWVHFPEGLGGLGAPGSCSRWWSGSSPGPRSSTPGYRRSGWAWPRRRS